jgi:hypothetical protein
VAEQTKSTGQRRFSRRKVLGYGAASITAAAIATAAPALAVESNAARNLKTFTSVSQALTGRETLSAITAERIFQAMGGNKRDFIDPLERLASKVGSAPASWDSAERDLAGKIVRAWYLGLVGDGPEATVVSYEHALMFDAVADALKPRTFCAAQPGYWAQKPA